jgi:acetyl-CoA C-acetyltransferase
MVDVFVYDHARTPRGRGKKDGSLHEVPSVRLASHMLQALRDRNGLDTSKVDDIIMGCVDAIGEAGGDIARAATFEAGYATEAPGIQINRFCASGLDAINMGAGKIAYGADDIVIAGGVESMSRIGIGAQGGAWFMDPSVNIPAYFMPQGVSADLIATKYGFSRDDVDAYAVESQKRAEHSWKNGYFDKSVVPVKDINGLTILDRDEHMRPGTDMQTLASLNASFGMMAEMGGFGAVAIQAHPEIEIINHVHHAGNSSGIVDGASAVLFGTKEMGERFGMKPRARIRAMASIGSEPGIMLTGPTDVSRKALKKAGMNPEDIDLYELNEAFASVVLLMMQNLNIPHEKMNVNGGAIAMGHPLGATGGMLMGTMIDELERSGKETALITLCVGAGMGTATIIERV